MIVKPTAATAAFCRNERRGNRMRLNREAKNSLQPSSLHPAHNNYFMVICLRLMAKDAVRLAEINFVKIPCGFASEPKPAKVKPSAC